MEDGMHVDEYGNKVWYKDGQYHREDGPAIIWANGTEWWYKNGQRHRLDGPAIEHANGDKGWYKNGTWYYSFDNWLKELVVSDEDKVFLKLKWA